MTPCRLIIAQVSEKLAVFTFRKIFSECPAYWSLLGYHALQTGQGLPAIRRRLMLTSSWQSFVISLKPDKTRSPETQVTICQSTRHVPEDSDVLNEKFLQNCKWKNPEERTSLDELHFFLRLFCNCISSAAVMWRRNRQEYRIVRNADADRCGTIWGTISEFAWTDWEKLHSI